MTITGETYIPERYFAKTEFISSKDPDPPINIKVEPGSSESMVRITWDPPTD